MTDVNIWGNRVSPPAVSLSNRTPACGAPAAPNSGWEMGQPGFPIPLPAGTASSPRRAGQPGFPIVLPAGAASSPRRAGQPGFPIPLPAGTASSPRRAGQPGFPIVLPAGAASSPRREGQPGFPIPLPAGTATSPRRAGQPGFPACGEPVEPHPCLRGRQALSTPYRAGFGAAWLLPTVDARHEQPLANVYHVNWNTPQVACPGWIGVAAELQHAQVAVRRRSFAGQVPV